MKEIIYGEEPKIVDSGVYMNIQDKPYKMIIDRQLKFKQRENIVKYYNSKSYAVQKAKQLLLSVEIIGVCVINTINNSTIFDSTALRAANYIIYYCHKGVKIKRYFAFNHLDNVIRNSYSYLLSVDDSEVKVFTSKGRPICTIKNRFIIE